MSPITAGQLLPVSAHKLQLELQHEDPDLRRLIGLSKAYENIQRKALLDVQQNQLNRSHSYVGQQRSNEQCASKDIVSFDRVYSETQVLDDTKPYSTIVENVEEEGEALQSLSKMSYYDNQLSTCLVSTCCTVSSPPVVTVTVVSLELDDDDDDS